MPVSESIAVDEAVLARAVERVLRPAFLVERCLDDPKREGYHHQKVLPKAGPLLRRDRLAEDPVGAVSGAIKASVNLLSSFETMLALTLLEAPEPADVRTQSERLLYGDGPLADRVDAFVAWGTSFPDDGDRKRSVNATVASYLLAVSDPGRYAFCKPEIYAAAARALAGEAVSSAEPGRRVAHCTDLYRALLPLLRDRFGLPVSDLMHVHIACYLVAKGEGTPGWAGLSAEPVADESHDRHLQTFAAVADEWLSSEAARLEERHQFFEAFFEPERLARAEWPDVQEMGTHLHSVGANALARGRAFGNPNHPIEHYRRTFEYLARGADPLALRLDRLNTDPEFKLFGLGESVLGEIAGQLFADSHSLLNGRSEAAMARLGRWGPDEQKQPLGARFEAFGTAVAPVAEAYARVVGQRTDLPIRLEVDHFLYWLDETNGTSGPPPDGAAVWLIAPGADAALWEASYREGRITIGWDDLGDLRQYGSVAEIAARLKVLTGAAHNPTNDARACDEFAHALRPGDLLFVKQGRRRIVGHGVVRSGYEYDETRKHHRHVRRVEWRGRGEWSTGDRVLPTKTLTGISKYPGMVAELRALVGLAPEPAVSASPSFWWLNFSPAVWSIASAEAEHEQTYTSHNEAGNKRQRYAHFEAARPGDPFVGYETGSVRRVVALGRITRALHETEDGDEAIAFEKLDDYPDGPTLDQMRGVSALADAEPVRSNQASLLRLTADEYAAVEALLSGDPVVETATHPPYTVEDAEREVFAADGDVRRWVALLRSRKNLMLLGAPGVGKTFRARRLGYALVGEKDPARVQTVQFHQSYAYEDFVQGYRPTEAGGFTLRNGVFHDFCRRAQADADRDYVFVVDEINRGNVSKVLGEVMMLIEPDKRGPEFAIRLAYEPRAGVTFHVPENVHLVGLMNTADRSLAVVDYALRRRFAFVTMRPAFGNARFRQSLRDSGASEAFVASVAERLGALNAAIEASADLGRGYCVGHSYFCPRPSETADWSWYRRVVETEVAPLLDEYWFDERSLADDAVEALLAGVPAVP